MSHPTQPALAPAPTCPRCGSGRVERTNRKTGVKFTGCAAYPRCNWTLRTTRHELVGSIEARRVVTEDDVGDYDERDPMLDAYGDLHDY